MLATGKRRKSHRLREAATTLWDAYWADPSPETRNRLAELYLPMVRRHAEWLGRHLETSDAIIGIDDLASAGAIGLMQAIEHYAPDARVQFETYCFSRVRGAMRDEMRGTDPLKRKARRRAGAIAMAWGVLRGRLGREPLRAEVAEHLGLTDGEYLAAEVDFRLSVAVSMDIVWCYDEYANPLDMHQFCDDAAPGASYAAELADDAAEALRTLSPVDRRIMSMYYLQDTPMKQIGRAIGLAESRISQRIAGAIATIRRRYADRGRVPIGGAR